MDDLLSGRAVSLYYYNLAYGIPLYLHIGLKSDISCFDMRRRDLDYKSIKREINAWRDYARNYLSDYYPLTPHSIDAGTWIGWQIKHARARRRRGAGVPPRRESLRIDPREAPRSGTRRGLYVDEH